MWFFTLLVGIAPITFFEHAPFEHKGVLGSPPSFYNGLGIIYIVSFQGKTIDFTTRDMGSKFRYVLGKVLGT